MLKFLAINNLLSVSKKNKKKFLLVTNFTISFIIAAIITSAVSIFYESKLTKLRSDLVKLNNDQRIAREWLVDTTSLDNDNTDYSFIQLLAQNIDIKYIDMSNPRYNFHQLAWLPLTIELSINEARKIGIESKKYLENNEQTLNLLKKNFINGNSLDSFEKEVKESLDFVYSILKDTRYYDNPIKENILADQKFFGPKDGELNKIIREETKKLYMINNIMGLLYSEKNSELSEEISQINKKILTATKNSTTTIFYAFLLQIIIFIIIQVFEVREVK